MADSFKTKHDIVLQDYPQQMHLENWTETCEAQHQMGRRYE